MLWPNTDRWLDWISVDWKCCDLQSGLISPLQSAGKVTRWNNSSECDRWFDITLSRSHWFLLHCRFITMSWRVCGPTILSTECTSYRRPRASIGPSSRWRKMAASMIGINCRLDQRWCNRTARLCVISCSFDIAASVVDHRLGCRWAIQTESIGMHRRDRLAGGWIRPDRAPWPASPERRRFARQPRKTAEIISNESVCYGQAGSAGHGVEVR